MNLQEKAYAHMSPPPGLYLHVPFCAHTCDFCGFYQKAPQRKEIEAYLDCMQLELLGWQPELAGVSTVFWGGGTPGLLMAADLHRLGSDMLNAMGARPQEWSIEMAPSTVKADKLDVLADLGCTRVSMGVQSFSAATLERLGRLHAPPVIYRAYELLRSRQNLAVNIDLIFAIPGQSFSEWEADLLEAIRLQPDHISTYCLTFEEDTALWAKLQKGQVKRRSEEDEAQFYLRTWEILAEHGYQQYEVSNFCRPGFECRHNIHTWQMGEWAACGPSASSQWRGWRRTNPHSLDIWMEGVRDGKMQYFDENRLDDATLAADSLVFGLRMNDGVNLSAIATRYPSGKVMQYQPLLDGLVEEGLMEINSPNYRLTPSGRLLADSIAEEILAV
jgi:oxygen-independent coproporphyrinogen III oxidase